VQGPAIAEQDDVRDASACENVGEESRPFGFRPAEIKGAAQAPEQTVTRIEIDAADLVSARCQRLPQAREESARHSLKEQEIASA
jgi:hypothetical protein